MHSSRKSKYYIIFRGKHCVVSSGGFYYRLNCLHVALTLTTATHNYINVAAATSDNCYLRRYCS